MVLACADNPRLVRFLCRAQHGAHVDSCCFAVSKGQYDVAQPTLHCVVALRFDVGNRLVHESSVFTFMFALLSRLGCGSAGGDRACLNQQDWDQYLSPPILSHLIEIQAGRLLCVVRAADRTVEFSDPARPMV